jgi:hypothetical protein
MPTPVAMRPFGYRVMHDIISAHKSDHNFNFDILQTAMIGSWKLDIPSLVLSTFIRDFNHS